MSNPEVCVKCPNKVCFSNENNTGFMSLNKVTKEEDFKPYPIEKCIEAIAMLGLGKILPHPHNKAI
jgi:hypothetical protein